MADKFADACIRVLCQSIEVIVAVYVLKQLWVSL